MTDMERDDTVERVERVARAIVGHLTGVPWEKLPETKQEHRALCRAGKLDYVTPYREDVRGIARDAMDAMPYLEWVDLLNEEIVHLRAELDAIAAMQECKDDSSTGWQHVDGYVGFYEVSDTGVVRKTNGTMLSQWANDDGYLLVRLSNPRAVERVHRLVARAFCLNPDSKPNVNHIDHDPSNNMASNLEWCTQKENLNHARAHGRMPDNYWVGKRSPNASLSDAAARKIINLYESGGYTHSGLAAMFKISKRAVGRLLTRETYQDV